MGQNRVLQALAKRFLSPDTIALARSSVLRAEDIAEASKLWNWEVSRTSDGYFDLLYAGRAQERWRAVALFPDHEHALALGTRALSGLGRPTVFLSELRLRGALMLPCELVSLVRLKRPLADIMADFDTELRRRIRRLSEQQYRLEEAPYEQVATLHREMFVPFARARHGEHAQPHSLSEFQRFLRFGRIDLLFKGDELVGAQAGYAYPRSGSARWTTDRFGYSERVFSDPRQLADANTMNIHLACQRALEGNYDYYDMGTSPALPDGGLLQFKRRRRSILEAPLQPLYVYAHVPIRHRPQILARAPLFAVERSRLVLHAGVTRDCSDDALMNRFHEWGYGGIAIVKLWTERTIAPRILERLTKHYRDRGFETTLVVHDEGAEIGASTTARANGIDN